ncbi:MAG: metalloregulator ArsR/SmtB family transcription factor [Anaerolineaceae bacterium]|nr:metalloregulator ArsR/SmtB family transcription factor [Anaerolineaceae bacterium]
MNEQPIPDAAPTEELLTFFKALSDANRLKIIGVLASQAATVEQLAAALNLGASTVSHHLSRLSEAGLVSARADGYYSVYSLQTDVLEEMSRRLLKRENITRLAEDADIDAFDRKVLRDFLTPEGRIKAFPAQEKKLLVILRHVLQAFEPDRRYTEKEVNELIKERFHEDCASIRRHFIEYKFMSRENGVYWRL